MKLYILIVSLIITVVIGIELANTIRYKPTLHSFSDPQTVSGFLTHDHEIGSTRSHLLFNGEVLACAVQFNGTKAHCDDRVTGFKAGIRIRVAYVQLKSSNGPIKVATEIVFDDGRQFINPPQKIMHEWVSASLTEVGATLLLSIVFLILVPLFSAKK